MPGFLFDPVQRSAEAENVVMRGNKRLYHKFRAAPYYGGIATADAIGCSFLCAYCWNYGRNEDPGRFGRFFTPQEVASNLLEIARRRNLRLFRVTGSEPILGEASFEHLVQVIGILLQEAPHSKFVLETNGLMLGYQESLPERLKFRHLLARIAIKGVDPVSFEKITGAKSDFFPYPLLAVKHLQSCGVRAWPALMEDLFDLAQINNLKSTLSEVGIKADLELECLEPYPFVVENMRRRGVALKKNN